MAKKYNVTIVGAGLAGLATAIALAQAGHEVTVLESRPSISEIGAGIQLPPNACRILFSWGLRDALEARSSAYAGVYIKRYSSGKVLCRTDNKVKDGSVELPHWTIYRPDYQEILYEAAIKHGVKVRFSATVEDPNDIDADLVVLADGIGSKTRKHILGSQEPALIDSKSAYRVLIPQQDMLNDAVTAECITGGYRHRWLGPHRYITAYQVAKGGFFNIVLIHPKTTVPGEWNRRGSVEAMRKEFSDFEPVVHRLLDKATECMDWTLGRLPPLSTWSSHDGRILLVGDAAHAMTPDYAQGAAMCVEDAAVLACCLSEASSVQEATTAFYDLRYERVEKMQQASWEMGELYGLPDGNEQRKRDDVYKTWTDAEEKKVDKPDDALAKRNAWVYEWDAVKEARAFWNVKNDEDRAQA